MSGKGSEVKPSGVHFVGSVNLSSTEEVFRRLSSTLPNSLARIPDGETGTRQNFVAWQDTAFLPSPFVMHPHLLAAKGLGNPTPTDQIVLGDLKYDDAALASYKEFVDLRNQGVIKAGVRFQVSLPTPVNVIPAFVAPQYLAQVEPIYEKKILQVVRRIQDNIPSKDLAIQWDMCVELALLEAQEVSGHLQPWFSPLKEGIVDRISRLSAAVDKDVDLGYHLCYGDLNHKHFVEPKDTGLLVEVANYISKVVTRPIQYIQMPVPKDRKDGAYFLPLKDLKLQKETELFLGLIHPGDVDGTWDRIQVAGTVVSKFGVSGECGLGRSSSEELEGFMEVCTEVMGADA